MICGDIGEQGELTRYVGIIVSAIAELSERVVAPASSLTVVEESTCMAFASANGGWDPTCAEVDGVTGCVGIDVVSVAELAVSVVSPTSDLIIVEESTCM